MKLTQMRVTDFKCVLDSEWFAVGDLTCLVGKNESGKTALLEALEKLNSVQDARANFDETDNYPRMHLTDYQRSEEVATPIETQWELASEEQDYINGLVGVPVLLDKCVKLGKNYKNQLIWTVSVDYPAATKHYLDSSPLTPPERQALGNPPTPEDLIQALKGLAEPTPNQQALSQTLGQRLPGGNLRSTITTYLESRLPKFLYYSSYDLLPGQVSLQKLTADIASNSLNQPRGNKVFVALLSMVETTPQTLGAITKFEPLIAQLEAVGNSLSSRIFTYWTQNKHLAVEFRFDEAEPGTRHPSTLARSSGLGSGTTGMA
ncbi:MAG: AAA family ATPase [Candidatus Dormibacteria bacterium]